MISFELEKGEYIITESEDVTWASNDGIEIDRMILTNRNIFLLYREKESFFARPTKKVVQMSLSGIRIINGQLMVNHVRNWDYGTCLEIQHAKGKEVFHFSDGGKRRAIEWENEINRLFGRGPVKANTFGSLAAELTGSLFDVAESAVESVSMTARQFIDGSKESGLKARNQSQTENNFEAFSEDYEDIPISDGIDEPQDAEYYKVPAEDYEEAIFEDNSETVDEFYQESGYEQQTMNYCPNCGAKLSPEENFCSECGTPTKSSDGPPPIPDLYD